jgi:hypothetical protein
MIVVVTSPDDPLETTVFRVLFPPGPGHHDFHAEWQQTVAAVKERTGKFGYPLSTVISEMVKLGWDMTRLEYIKVSYY